MMRFLLIFLLLLPFKAIGVPIAPTGLQEGVVFWPDDGTLQARIYDDGLEGWVVAKYLGNFATKPIWQDGPRLEVGGMRPGGHNCTQAADKLYCAYGYDSTDQRVVELNETTGSARLFMFSEGTHTGPTEEVRGGAILYHEPTSTTYVAGLYCLRKIVDDQDGTRSVVSVAGQCGTPCTSTDSSLCDGTGAAAQLKLSYGWAVQPDGNIYMAEVRGLRKITPAGVVSTVPLTRPEEPTAPIWAFAGPAGGFHLYPGDDANTLYMNDQYGASPLGPTALRIDLATNVITRIAGVIGSADPYNRRGLGTDGPALTHASVVGGMRGLYAPFYSSFFFSGQDADKLRRVAADGWAKTIMLDPRPGTAQATFNIAMAQSPNYYSAEWARIVRFIGGPPIPYYGGYDNRGGLYTHFSRDLNGVWRAYNSLEGGTE